LLAPFWPGEAASASARRVIRSSVAAQRHTAMTSSGSVVTIPVTHINAAADRWSDSASAAPRRASYVGISGSRADNSAIPSTAPATPMPNAAPTRATEPARRPPTTAAQASTAPSR
jgi:hypothetical protein